MDHVNGGRIEVKPLLMPARRGGKSEGAINYYGIFPPCFLPKNQTMRTRFRLRVLPHIHNDSREHMRWTPNGRTTAEACKQ